MTGLDDLISRGLSVLDGLSGESFTFRGIDRLANVSDAQSEKSMETGGYRTANRLVIVYNRATGEIDGLRVGETVQARGLKLKITRLVSDATSHTLECVDSTA